MFDLESNFREKNVSISTNVPNMFLKKIKILALNHC